MNAIGLTLTKLVSVKIVTEVRDKTLTMSAFKTFL